MHGESARSPVLNELYDQFLADEDAAAFVHRVSQRYQPSTIERLVSHSSRMVRRAAVLALGYLGDYEVNACLGKALTDADRGVRLLAENGIRSVWCRLGTEEHRREITAIVHLNGSKQFEEARGRASDLIADAPWFAEAWNQRAIANYCTDRYRESIDDCRQALEINPYHFGAAAGMGQCYLKLGEQASALEAFRRALKLNPGLEGVRANVVYLQRLLKRS